MAMQFEDVSATVFENTHTSEAPKSGDQKVESLHNLYRAYITDARDYEESYLSGERIEADEYYKGILPRLNAYDTEEDNEEAGRSTVVATEVRDTIMAIMPSLIRIFTSAEHPVEFVATNKYTVDLAAQQTDYIAQVFFDDNPGFLILYSMLMDAMNKGGGVVQWWTDKEVTSTESTYNDITMEQVQFVLAQPGVDIVEHTEYLPVMEGAEPTYDLSVKKIDRSNRTRIEPVPPEEFRIDKRAKSVLSATLVGREREVTTSFLAMRGYTKEWLESYTPVSSSFTNTEEKILRNDAYSDNFSVEETITFGEYWVRVDSDGDGIDELHYIHQIGEEIVMDEMVSRPKMAYLTPDPEPHTLIGSSVNKQVQDLQRIKTNILRTTLDSLAASIHGRMAVVENMVNMDDVLNDDIGAPIRMKNINSITPIPSMFVGQPAIDMMSYLDTIRQSRTGISEASKGLDPKALQSTNVNAVDMVITGAQERIELIARICAETGFKDMYKGLLIEITENPNKPRTMKLRGEWVDVNPDVFDPTMGIRVNPAIGRGSDLDRFQMLGQIAAKQEEIMKTLGVNNPICTPNNYLNTITDMLSIGGIKNVNRYFNNPTPEQLQAMSEAMNKPDPAILLAQSEMEKNKVKLAEAAAGNEVKREKDKSDDDFRRDKLEGELAVKAAEAGINIMDILERMQLERDRDGSAHVQANMDREENSKHRESDRSLDMAKHAANLADRELNRNTEMENAERDRASQQQRDAEIGG